MDSEDYVMFRPKQKTKNTEEEFKFIMYKELMKQRLVENPLEYFEYLKLLKHELSSQSCIGDINIETIGKIKSIESYLIISFRIFICELFYRAIHCFPLVSEYKIICSNEMTVSVIHFKQFDELDDQNETCIVKVSTCFDSFFLNKLDIMEIFTANRKMNPNYDIVNSIVLSMCMGGRDPDVKTSYIINKNSVKDIKKY
jgi:hypothetical protein